MPWRKKRDPKEAEDEETGREKANSKLAEVDEKTGLVVKGKLVREEVLYEAPSATSTG